MTTKMVPAVVAALIAIGSPAGAAGYRVVDLTPVGALESSVAAANGGFQVGDITVGLYREMCGPRVHCFSKQTHAELWAGTSTSFVDLNPPGYFTSTATGLGGNLQVGFGLGTQPVTSGEEHALMWSSSASSMIDLHPARYISSAAYATDGAAEVGSGLVSGDYKFQQYLHALLWFGSAAKVIDLNPVGSTLSEAFAIAKGYEFGYASASDGSQRAYAWTGSAGSGVDLNPVGYDASVMQGVDGNFEVGTITTSSKPHYYHAYLWTGRSNKGVDLNPPLCDASWGLAARGGKQVGWCESPWAFNAHALLWSGTAASYVDLHRYLPAGMKTSTAYAIDVNGTISGVATDRNDKSHAIRWIPTNAHSAMRL